MFEKYEQFKQVFDELKERKYSLQVQEIRKSLLAKLQGEHFSSKVGDYLRDMNENGVPFTHFEADPAPISQVKKIINALYHTELGLKSAESVDFRNMKNTYGELGANFLKLWNETAHQFYLACDLFTHFDIELWDFFKDEVDLLIPLFNQLQSFASTYSTSAATQLSHMDLKGIPFELGKAAGLVIDQFGEQQEDMDYEVITQFSAKLPGYLDQLTGMVSRFSSQVSTYEPHINKKELDALQDQALQLLNALEETRGSSIFLPIKTLKYLHIIRSTITLSMSIFNEAGLLTESTQDALRTKLAQLKYELLPELFAFTDKIEQQAMLKPGVLSNPLMDSVSALYDQLIYYTEKFVDFKSKGGELRTLTDGHFVSIRLDKLHQRQSLHHALSLKTKEVERATHKFYQILNKPQYQDLRIIDLPEETKKILLSHYKVMRSEILKLHLPMDQAILWGLTNQPTVTTRMAAPLRLMNRAWNAFWSWRQGEPTKAAHLLNTDSVADVQTLRPMLEAYLAKTIKTQAFYIQLNDGLVDDVSKSVKDLKLSTHVHDPLKFDEVTYLKEKLTEDLAILEKAPRPHTKSHALKIELTEQRLLQVRAFRMKEGQLTTFDELNMSDALMFYQQYEGFKSQLEAAERAYLSFHQLLQQKDSERLLIESNDEIKRKLRNLYHVFQPYFVSGLKENPNVKDIDQSMVKGLSMSATEFGPQERADKVVTPIASLHAEMVQWFQAKKSELQERCDKFANLSQKLMREELGAKNLDKEAVDNARAHHILRHDYYSKAIQSVHQTLLQLTQIFNAPIRAQLERKAEGLPYPELAEMNSAISQSEQAIGLKRLFNCLYHLEQIAQGLEMLNDQLPETKYVYQVYGIYQHWQEAFALAKALKDTPALAIIGGEIKTKLTESYAILLDIQKHYLHEPIEEEGVEPAPDPGLNHSAVLYYVLDVLKILPKHITAIRQDKNLTPAELLSMQQAAAVTTTDIERILLNSDSYFRLFLEIPTMYRLFRDLKQQLSELTTVTHDVAISNLERIHDEFMTKMLMEGDRWEDNMGLVPGTLTAPIKQVLDLYYQGLVTPLGLGSKKHLALVTSLVPFEKRKKALIARETAASQEMLKFEGTLVILERLQVRMRAYREANFAGSKEAESYKALMKTDFREALPILREVMPKLPQEFTKPDEFGKSIDDLLNGCVEPPTKWGALEERVARSIAYHQGKVATLRSIVGSAKEKSVFLEEQKVKQVELNLAYVEKYTEHCFHKQVKALKSKQVGFIHCSMEYGNKLGDFLETFKGGLVQQAKGAEDIDKKMEELLLEKAGEFEREYYKDYYHLEILMAAIDRLKFYIHQSNISLQSKRSVFESVRTLSKKSELLSNLETIANKKELSVKERITHLQEAVLAPTFRTRLLDHQHPDAFSFAWLTQWLVSFVELLGLYTPSHKKCYIELVKATKPPVMNMGKLQSQFGLFTTPAVENAPLEGKGPALKK